jgi:hypothetical protein
LRPNEALHAIPLEKQRDARLPECNGGQANNAEGSGGSFNLRFAASHAKAKTRF